MYNSVYYIYLFLFATCFGHPCAHHLEKIAVSMRHCYLSPCMGGVSSAGCIQSNQQPRRHLYIVTNTSDAYSNFLLMMGTWMPETCREEK